MARSHHHDPGGTPINPDDPVPRCGNLWRHGTTRQPEAVALVSDATNPGPGTPYCESCVRSFTSANHTAVRPHVEYFDPTHDRDDDPGDAIVDHIASDSTSPTFAP